MGASASKTSRKRNKLRYNGAPTNHLLDMNEEMALQSRHFHHNQLQQYYNNSNDNFQTGKFLANDPMMSAAPKTTTKTKVRRRRRRRELLGEVNNYAMGQQQQNYHHHHNYQQPLAAAAASGANHIMAYYDGAEGSPISAEDHQAFLYDQLGFNATPVGGVIGANTKPDRRSKASKKRLANGVGVGGGGAVSSQALARGLSRSRLDIVGSSCCVDCILPDCSGSSAISSGNYVATETTASTTTPRLEAIEALENFPHLHQHTNHQHHLHHHRHNNHHHNHLSHLQHQQILAGGEYHVPTSVLRERTELVAPGEVIEEDEGFYRERDEFEQEERRDIGGESDRITCLESHSQVSTSQLNSNKAPSLSTTSSSNANRHNNNNNKTNMATTTVKNHHTSNTNDNNNSIHKASNGKDVPCHQRASLERGLAMTEEERRTHGLSGFLPAAVQDQELQSRAVMNFLDNCKDDLGKYVYLRHLKDFNEKLFYYTITTNVVKCMPLVYTPTVGLACQKFSEIYMRPRGLFITANDAGRVKQILANWPEKDVRVIVVTDGERILGLGDLGANGMGISIGKLSLYTALAGIPPQNVLPITIDVGTNNEQNLKDPYYIGLRQPRVRGDKYYALIEEFMKAVVDRWGPSCLIQFEDFGNSTAFELLERYRDDYCTFNDDIQGTASVCLSGLITGAKVIGKRLRDCSFLFYGAGEANLGTAHLLIMAMVEDGLGEAEAKRHVWLVDSKGLVVSSRSDLSEHKRAFAQDATHIKNLEDIIGHTKPTAIIGASAQAGAFNESICKKMAQYNEKPIIFALSNPTSKAECTAAQAYEWTDGKCVFASGSPFDPVEHGGKTYITGQGNNAYIFPGVGLASIAAHTHIIPEETFLVAARALSDQVQTSDTSVGLVYPKLTKIRDVTLRVATRVLEYFYAERLATYRPEPSDKLAFLKEIQYDYNY